MSGYVIDAPQYEVNLIDPDGVTIRVAQIGIKGDAGDPGPAGNDGPPGADGKTVLNGSGAPSIGLGVSGDFYLDTTSWEIYGPKTGDGWGAGTSIIGPQGEQGPPGQDGINGVGGAAVRNGSAPPTSGDGSNGDFWIDTTAMEIYGPKVAGAWGAGTSLVGPQGEQGPQGDPGADGTPGANGATGATGPQGDPGPANTLSIGTVTTGAAGSSASATITGTAPTQTLSLTIPRGDTGATGPTGPTGPQGDTGPAGPNDVSTSTTSSITGVIAGAAGNLRQAVNADFPADVKAYDIPISFAGTPGNAQVLAVIPMVRAITLPAGLTGTQGRVLTTNPASTYTITLKQNGSSIGTISISTGGVFSFSFASQVSFTAGDYLTAEGQATADASLKDFGFTLAGALV